MDTFSTEELVGRSTERSQIDRYLDLARAGETTIAVLQGPMGSGKTTLLNYAVSRGREAGMRTIFVSSHHTASHAPHYLLNSITNQLGDQLTAGGEQSQFELVTEYQDLRFRVAAEVLSRIRRAADAWPILLVVDDVQWADAGSIAALEFVAEQLQSSPVLILLGIRTVSTRLPGSELAALLRHAGDRIIDVEPFTSEEVGQFLARVSGEPPAPDRLQQISERSGGLPLLVKLLSRTPSASDSDNVPNDALRVVLSYLSFLPEECNEILRLIAAFGRPMLPGDLQAISEIDHEKLAGLIDLAVSEDVIAYQQNGELWFSHPLMPESLLTELSTLQLAGIHAAITRHLVKLVDDDPNTVASAARHAALAIGMVEQQTLVDLTLRASEESLRRGEWQQAAEQLAAIDRVELSELDASQRARALFARARTISVDGLLPSTRKAWPMMVEAFELFLSTGDTERAVEVAVYPLNIGGIAGAEELTSRALELATPGSETAGWLLARQGVALADSGQDTEALSSIESALDIARRQGYRNLEARAMVHLSQAHYRSFRPTRCIETSQAAINLAMSNGDSLSLQKATPFLFLSLLMTGKLDDAGKLIDAETVWLENNPHPQLIVSTEFQRQMLARLTVDRELVFEAFDDDYPLELAKSYARAAMFSDCDRILDEQWQTLVVNGDDLNSQRHLILAIACRILVEPLGEWKADTFGWIDALKPLRDRLGSEEGLNETNRFDAMIVNAALALASDELIDPVSAQALHETGNIFHPEIGVCVRRVEGRVHWKNGDSTGARACFEEALQFARDAGLPTEQRLAQSDLATVDQVHGIGGRDPWNLTTRELEVAQMAAGGLTNAEIAAKLHLSHHTVGHHIRNALNKTGLPNRTALATWISSRETTR